MPANYIEPYPRSAYAINRGQMLRWGLGFVTYDESGKAKVANLDIEVGVDEHIMTLDVAMNDA